MTHGSVAGPFSPGARMSVSLPLNSVFVAPSPPRGDGAVRLDAVAHVWQ